MQTMTDGGDKEGASREVYLQSMYQEALHAELKKLERRRRYTSIQGAVVALTASVIGFTFTFLSIVSQRTGSITIRRSDLEVSQAAKLAWRSDIEKMNARVKKIEETVAKATPSLPASALSIEQKRMSTDIQTLNSRLNTLNAAILSSPERALSIPLLRRDIDEASKRLVEYRAASRSDVDRLYEQQKWILSGIGTILLAVSGGAITIILRSLPKTGRDDP